MSDKNEMGCACGCMCSCAAGAPCICTNGVREARLLSAGGALAGAMKVALPWLELRANEETVATARAALSAWEEATKPAPLDGKGEEVKP
jgi:hypothetical protein